MDPFRVPEIFEVPIRGRDYASGLPKEVTIKNTHVRAALAKSLQTIVDSVHEVIEEAPPELVGDILRNGIYICGGGAMLRGIDRLIGEDVGVPVWIVENPLTCVARGLGMMVDNFDAYRGLLNHPPKPLSINL